MSISFNRLLSCYPKKEMVLKYQKISHGQNPSPAGYHGEDRKPGNQRNFE
jgi:hypothetical protein